jgi:hypothetical protein
MYSPSILSVTDGRDNAVSINNLDIRVTKKRNPGREAIYNSVAAGQVSEREPRNYKWLPYLALLLAHGTDTQIIY